MSINTTEIKQSINNFLNEQASSTSLVLFRIAFGLIMLWEISRFFQYDWIKHYFIEPSYFFSYTGFEWLSPLPDDLWHPFFIGLGICAFCIAIGFLYRISSTLFFLGFIYIFLLDKTNYLNQLYLASLLAFLMALIPAHRNFSVDAWLWPKIKKTTVPNWVIVLLVFQFGVVYFYGGIAKIDADWLAGQPLQIWLKKSGENLPLFASILEKEWMALIISWSGLVIDLIAIPCLLWKPTRSVMLVVLVLFHLINATLFNIGIFPWLMLAGLLFFLNISTLENHINSWFSGKKNENSTPNYSNFQDSTTKLSRFSILGIWLFILLQMALPLRHFFIQGDVSWTEEGHRFSWQMMQRDKAGKVKYLVVDKNSGDQKILYPYRYLTKRQVEKLPCHPDMLFQFAHFLESNQIAEGNSNFEIRALAKASLNHGTEQFIIDPEFNLISKAKYDVPAPWILRYNENHIGR